MAKQRKTNDSPSVREDLQVIRSYIRKKKAKKNGEVLEQKPSLPPIPVIPNVQDTGSAQASSQSVSEQAEMIPEPSAQEQFQEPEKLISQSGKAAETGKNLNDDAQIVSEAQPEKESLKKSIQEKKEPSLKTEAKQDSKNQEPVQAALDKTESLPEVSVNDKQEANNQNEKEPEKAEETKSLEETKENSSKEKKQKRFKEKRKAQKEAGKKNTTEKKAEKSQKKEGEKLSFPKRLEAAFEKARQQGNDRIFLSFLAGFVCCGLIISVISSMILYQDEPIAYEPIYEETVQEEESETVLGSSQNYVRNDLLWTGHKGYLLGTYYTAYPMNVRSEPLMEAMPVAQLDINEPLEVLDIVEGLGSSVWGQLDNGWICLQEGNDIYCFGPGDYQAREALAIHSQSDQEISRFRTGQHFFIDKVYVYNNQLRGRLVDGNDVTLFNQIPLVNR